MLPLDGTINLLIYPLCPKHVGKNNACYIPLIYMEVNKSLQFLHVCNNVCFCACACERETMRQKETETGTGTEFFIDWIPLKLRIRKKSVLQ